MELMELISVPSLTQEFEEKCPFTLAMENGPAKADESIADDDLEGVQAAQANDGGTLGDNLLAGKAGVADGGPFEAKDFLYRQPANDTNRGRKTRLRMPEYKEAEAGDFPYTVAAHHLIPGNASLYKDEVQLFNYMKDGGKVKSLKGKEYTIKGHIGYDVNGSHNAVWLPGNYAIKTAKPERKKGDKILPARESTTPVDGVSWRALADDYADWQFKYVAGACKAASGQFHDTHETPYSASVRKNLANIVTALAFHFDNCEDCKSKTEVPPPFRIKRRLFALSQKLRGFVIGPPGAWKKPWFTSERWSGQFFKGGKLTRDFYRAYVEAKETRPDRIPI
jgi:hypothetical protein